MERWFSASWISPSCTHRRKTHKQTQNGRSSRSFRFPRGGFPLWRTGTGAELYIGARMVLQQQYSGVGAKEHLAQRLDEAQMALGVCCVEDERLPAVLHTLSAHARKSPSRSMGCRGGPLPSHYRTHTAQHISTANTHTHTAQHMTRLLHKTTAFGIRPSVVRGYTRLFAPTIIHAAARFP